MGICGPDGIWVRISDGAGALRPGPALFLDRDGTIVEEVGYLHRAGDVRLIEGAVRVIAAANARAIPVIVVTNQAGIGRGLFDWADLVAVEAHIEMALAALGARLDAVLASPFHPDGRPPYRDPDHPGRKPNPGMLLRAASLFAIDLETSWIIGDRASDIAAGRAAGLAGGIHVATGWGREPGEREAALAHASVGGHGGGYDVLTAGSIFDAARNLPFLAGTVDSPAGA